MCENKSCFFVFCR
uniref:Uncharacterized protein n=1 Tax=Lepeophtheirus salmonis TaxID=72036 RepID=A0A0K2V9K0_LEPSM